MCTLAVLYGNAELFSKATVPRTYSPTVPFNLYPP